jgi:hypothetical protein
MVADGDRQEMGSLPDEAISLVRQGEQEVDQLGPTLHHFLE